MSRHRVRLFRSYLFFAHEMPSLIDQVMEARRPPPAATPVALLLPRGGAYIRASMLAR